MKIFRNTEEKQECIIWILSLAVIILLFMLFGVNTDNFNP